MIQERVQQLREHAQPQFNRAKRLLQASYYAKARRAAVHPDVVLYESFGGNGMLCNPEAIFTALHSSSEFSHLRHVWVLSDFRRYRSTIERFANDERVTFVRQGSPAYFRALATAGFLVNNSTFPVNFAKREEQVYLNTWHGIPLKLMGFDMPDGAYESGNVLRNFVSADFLVSANPFMTERMFGDAYKLSGIYRGAVIEAGYPRIDRQRLSPDDQLRVRADLEDLGLPLNGRKIVLYAPTWKGPSIRDPQDDIDELHRRVDQLQRALPSDEYIVLLKTHQVLDRYASSDSRHRRVAVPNEFPTNLLLGVTSALVTDYSSLFFDYLATGGPIFFYAPDHADYEEERGTYFPREDWPGEWCDTLDSLAGAIVRASEAGNRSGVAARYGAWRERFTPNEDGHSTDRVIDVVFRGMDSEWVRDLHAERPVRKSILIYIGGMRTNGITSSALNLLHAIDHTRYDVSVVLSRSIHAQERENQTKIHPAVRQFLRTGAMNIGVIGHLQRRAFQRGARAAAGGNILRRAWLEEWNRCFGSSQFDRVVDFSGYSPFWASLLLNSPAAKRSIWLHNDMRAEVNRLVGSRRRMRRSLTALFGLYGRFDRLVSVSEGLREFNQENLGEFASADAFVSARNLIDAPRILESAEVGLMESATAGVDAGGGIRWAAELAGGETTWFVNVGRLSPEKNQARLLRAFARVHAQRPDTRLLLLGEGPLRLQLENLISELGLRDVAVISGNLRNPFPAMRAADCLVVSSNYEGQPMVILEAAVLGLPIVSTGFRSVRDALPNDTIRVTPSSTDGLAQGMIDYLNGRVQPSSLDGLAYNREALGETLAAMQLDGRQAADEAAGPQAERLIR